MAAGPGSGPGGHAWEGDAMGSGEVPAWGFRARQRQPLAGTRRLWGRNANMPIPALPLAPGQHQ